MISKILISSDLLRTRSLGNRLEYFHKNRLNGYWELLQYQLKTAVNLPVEKFSPFNTDFDMVKFYNLCGLECRDEQSWFEIYDLKEIPQEAVKYYQNYIENSLVIYHETPDIIKTIHNKLNIPYIDLNIHPIRFLDDIFFGFQTNNEKIFDRIKKYQIDEELFYIQAGLHKARIVLSPPDIKPDSILFAGQTNIDKSLYSGRKFLSIFDFKDKIEEYGKKYSKVYYKPHPYNKDLDKIYEFLRQYPFVKIINENIYKIISSENLRKVCAVTSGILHEAKYFDKDAEFLGNPYLRFDYSKDCAFSETLTLSVYDEFLYPHFWSDVLQDILPVKQTPKLSLPKRPNRVRAAINGYWGIEQIDPTVYLLERKYDSIIKKLQGQKDGALMTEKEDTHKVIKFLGIKMKFRKKVF